MSSTIIPPNQLTGEFPRASGESFVPEDSSPVHHPHPDKLRRLGKAIVTAPLSAGREYKQTYVQAREDTQYIKSLASPSRHSALGYAVWKAVYGDRHEDDGILTDYREHRRLMNDQHQERIENGTAVRKIDMIRYNAWRWFGAAYQGGDDLATFSLFKFVEESMGTAAAFAVTAPVSGLWADGMGEGEREAQTWKADAGGIDTVAYEGSMASKNVDATFNAALWQVQQTASAPREVGSAVEILTHAQIAQSSTAYAVANTSLYAAANRIPVVNGWGAFFTGVAAIQLFKHAANNYRESGEESERTENTN